MYSYNSRVRYSEVDQEGKLTLHALLDYFQDGSIFHSEDLGIGISYLKQEQVVWLLSSWQIVAKRYPAYGERIKISTWPYDFKGFYGYRNFLMEDESGTRLAYANSVWVLLHTVNGKPIRILPKMQESYPLEPALTMEPMSRKIKIPEVLEPEESFPVHKYHLDTNQHVNNGKYILMAQEYLPEGFAIKQMRAEYRKAAIYGDRIWPSVNLEQNKATVLLGSGSAGSGDWGREQSPYAIIEFYAK